MFHCSSGTCRFGQLHNVSLLLPAATACGSCMSSKQPRERGFVCEGAAATTDCPAFCCIIRTGWLPHCSRRQLLHDPA